MAKRNLMRGYLCSGGGAVIWGLSGTAGQYLLGHYSVDPFWLTSVRMVCAGLVLMILAGREYKAMLNILKNKKDLIAMLGYSLMGLLLSQVSFLKCIQYSNAGTAGILQTLSVVMMAVIVCLRTRRLPDFREGLSIVLALVGVVLIATHGDLSQIIFGSESGVEVGERAGQRAGAVYWRHFIFPVCSAVEYAVCTGPCGVCPVCRRYSHRYGSDVYFIPARRWRPGACQGNAYRHA